MTAASEGRRLGPLPLEAMTPEQRAVAERIKDAFAMTGEVGGPFPSLLHSPELCDRLQVVGQHIHFESSVPVPLKEMAVIMVALKWQAPYPWHAHRRLAIEAGLDPAAIDAIAVGERPSLDTGGMAVYDFVSDLLATGGTSDESWASLTEHWGTRGAIDLIAAIGYYTIVAFALNVDRTPLPEGATPLPPLPS